MARLSFICLFTIALLHYACNDAGAQFTTILNIPPDPNIGDDAEIGSDTQLNLSSGGSIGLSFNAGAIDGSSMNVEVNVTGGNVGDQLLSTGSVINLTNGSIGDRFDAVKNSTVNISGGKIGSDFRAIESTVNISGGSLGERSSVFGLAGSASTINISGGTIGDQFGVGGGGRANVYGSEFRLNGELIPGLGAVGNVVDLVTLSNGSMVSGTLADGTPFAFVNYEPDGNDRIFGEEFKLHVVSTPPSGSEVINVPADAAPLGVHQGQTLNLGASGVIGDHFNAGWGSAVNITAGQVGRNFEAVGALVSITGGIVGNDFDALIGSTIDITGGTVGNFFDAFDGSIVNILGGMVGDQLEAYGGSVVNQSGGNIGTSFRLGSGAVANISGGTIGSSLVSSSGSELNVFGTQFFLGGVDITSSLVPNVPFIITGRSSPLSGILADGNSFTYQLGGGRGPLIGGTLTVTLVIPEPASFLLMMMSLAGLSLRGSRLPLVGHGERGK